MFGNKLGIYQDCWRIE